MATARRVVLATIACGLWCTFPFPAPASAPAPRPSRVLGPDLQPRLLSALSPPPEGIPGAGGARLLGVSIAQATVTIRYGFPSGEVAVTLQDPGLPCPGCPANDAFGVSAPAEGPPAAIASWVAGRLPGGASDWWTGLRNDGTPGHSVETRIDRSVSLGDPSKPFSAWFRVAQASWAVLFLALLAATLLRLRRAGPASLRDPAVLFLGSLGVRLLAANWGPGDMHIYFATFYGLEEPVFGPGTDPLWIPLVRWLQGTENVFVVTNLVAGALAPVFLLAFLERTGAATRSARVLAAIVLMVLPIAVRHSGDAHRHALVLSLGMLSLWGLSVALSGQRWLGLALAVPATILCFLTRPEGSLLFLLQGVFLAAAVAGSWRSGARLLPSIGLACAVFLPYLVLVHYSGTGIGTSHVDHYFAQLGVPPLLSGWNQSWLNTLCTPALLIAALALGTIQAVRTRQPVLAWALFALLSISWFFPSMSIGMHGTLQLANLRYQALSLPMIAVLAGVGLDLLTGWLASIRRVAIRAGIAVLLAVGLVAGMQYSNRMVLPPSEADLEYLYLRDWIRDLPADSEIHFTYGSGAYREVEDMALPAPFWLSKVTGRLDVRWLEYPFDPHRPGRPQFFFRQSACTEAETLGRGSEGFAALVRDCRDALSKASPTPFRHAVLPNRLLIDLRPRPGVIEIGLYEMPESPESP